MINFLKKLKTILNCFFRFLFGVKKRCDNRINDIGLFIKIFYDPRNFICRFERIMDDFEISIHVLFFFDTIDG